MTTYEEISTCKHLNRLYHNQKIRLHIALIREYKRLSNCSDLYKRLHENYSKSLSKKLHNREIYEYYEG